MITAIRYAACALALGFLAPAWAINKCTDANGKVSFQDAPCPGQGEKIEVKPTTQGATPIQPAPSVTSEGVFGARWQRKNYLETQGIPQAQAELERHLQACAKPPEVVADAGPLRRSLASGTMFAQERADTAANDKSICHARTQELRQQIKWLEDELAALNKR